MSAFPESFGDRHVCILGLGYVGLTLATVMAEVGFQVHGVEIQKDVVARLAEGEPHFHEQGMRGRLKRMVQSGQLKVSNAVPESLRATVYIITVGTPLDDVGRVRLDMIENVSRQVAEVLEDGDLVVLRSTVKVGTTRGIVEPILRVTGKRFDLAFCPERTLEGNALEELRQLPQIVGGITHVSNVRAAQLFQFITPTVVRVSDVETAEMVKIIDNTSRDVHFAFANEVARLCDTLGISAVEVIASGKLGYARTKLPMPGPVGGPCLSKDPYLLADSFREFGIEPEIAMRARRLNERQPDEVVGFIAATAERMGIPSRPVIVLMGLAFKGRPATDDLRGTMARPILDSLRKHFPDAVYRGFDPEVHEDSIRDFGLAPELTLEKALTGGHLAIIANNHPLFERMDLEALAPLMARPGLIYDFWNSFRVADLKLPPGVGYAALGSHGRAIIPIKDGLR